MDTANLPARLAGRVARGRAIAEARMTSRAAVMRSTGRTTQDETSGLEVTEWATIEADSPFRLGGSERGGSGSRAFTVAGVEVTLAVREGHFPARTTDSLTFRDGDLIEVTAGENAGTVWRVVEGDWADQQTAYRVPIVAADRPEEWA